MICTFLFSAVIWVLSAMPVRPASPGDAFKLDFSAGLGVIARDKEEPGAIRSDEVETGAIAI
jgi:hypothetical protein